MNGNGDLPKEPEIRYCAAQDKRISLWESNFNHLASNVNDKVSGLTNQVASLRGVVEQARTEATDTRLLIAKTMNRLLIGVAIACVTFALTIVGNVVFINFLNSKLNGTP